MNHALKTECEKAGFLFYTHDGTLCFEGECCEAIDRLLASAFSEVISALQEELDSIEGKCEIRKQVAQSVITNVAGKLREKWIKHNLGPATLAVKLPERQTEG